MSSQLEALQSRIALAKAKPAPGGVTGKPDYELLERVADALGTTVEDLIHDPVFDTLTAEEIGPL